MSHLPRLQDARATYLAPDYHAGADRAAGRMRSEAADRASTLRTLGVRSLYEIGCGPGHFLDACRDRGIWAQGIDPAATAIAARGRGHTVHSTFVEQFKPERRVDALGMWEVLEHLTDPLEVLTHVRTWLNPGGYIALSTPSVSGVPARLLGSRFPMITPPDHLALFSRSGLERILTRAGFTTQKVSSFSGLAAPELQRGFEAYLFGSGALGRFASSWLARASTVPMRWVDGLGLGTSLEVLARAA